MEQHAKLLFILGLFMITISGVNALLSDGLVAYWKLDDNTATPVDSVLEKYNLTTEGVRVFQTLMKMNGGYNESNSGRHISLPLPAEFNGSNSVCLSGWFTLPSTLAPASNYWLFTIVDSADDGTYSFGALSDTTTPASKIDLVQNAGALDRSASVTVPRGSLNYFTFCKDQPNLRWYVYVNGTVIFNATYTKRALVNTYRLRLWSANTDPYGFNQGSADEVGVWNRTLTPAEATVLWNSGAGCGYSNFSTSTTTCTSGASTALNSCSPPASGTWTINVSDNCNVTVAHAMNGTNLIINGSTVYTDRLYISAQGSIKNFTSVTWKGLYTNVWGLLG